MPSAKRTAHRNVFLACQTNNPLKDPGSAVYALSRKFSKYLHMPDPVPLYAMLSAAAGNMLPGIPVWMFLVGAPSTGKTELAISLSGLDNSVVQSVLEGRQTFISGTGKKDRSRDATGGLLFQIGKAGTLILPEGTTLLNGEDRRAMKEVWDVLKVVYDGHYSRPVGSDGGRSISWGPGNRLGIVGAVTQDIDNYEMPEQGLRFLYVRFKETEGWQEALRAARRTVGREEMQEELRDAVTMFFSDAGLSWECLTDEKELVEVKGSGFDEWVSSLAIISSVCRGGVKRDRWRRVVARPVREGPGRLTGTFKQLVRGGMRIGLDDEQVRHLTARVAIDTIPLSRGLVMRRLIERGERGAQTEELLGLIEMGEAGMDVLKDMVLLGAVEELGGGGKGEGVEKGKGVSFAVRLKQETEAAKGKMWRVGRRLADHVWAVTSVTGRVEEL